VTTGWGIVGTGGAADRLVAPGIEALPNAEIVAVVGSSKEKADAYAEKHGGTAYASYDDLLADDSVDVVYIATPNALHADQAIAAARAGKDVFCDKPLATTVAEAKAVVGACDAAGVKLGINFQTRHHEGMAEVKQAIAAGSLGEPVVVECEVSPGRSPLGGWRTNRELAGLGTINNLGVHAYDLLRYLLDAEVEEVTVLTNVGRRDELETVALALLRFSNGALAYVNANQAVPNHSPDLVVYGSAGRVVATGVTRPFIERGTIEILAGEDTQTLEVSTKDSFIRAVAAFQGALDAGETPNASGLDGLRSVQLTDAMARSAREARTVEVER
jgi:1,5-anhydro-D-fructose reductase (1,5-anhydro-D-mannitol-forming)